MMVLGVLGVFAFAFYSAREQRLARARELTNQALLELLRDPAASAHLALAALSGDDGNRRADYALRQAMTLAAACSRPSCRWAKRWPTRALPASAGCWRSAGARCGCFTPPRWR
ncbi:hypothetical protein PEC18_37885 [Paucibacter sp. O1-1]|nr:hypothetical protein [Paucibacter sp. O1-1]MDA3831399.1 hypothetical protein [Paucibacter sp. O1-1]